MAVKAGGVTVIDDSRNLLNTTLKGYSEKVNVITNATGNVSLDLSQHNIFNITLVGNTVFTFTNAPATGTSVPATVILRQDSTGNRTALFNNAKYTEGVLPQLSTVANQIDVLSFFTVDGGSFYFGTFAMANVS